MVAILSVITLFSVVSTVYVDPFDRVYYTGDTAVKHAICILTIIVLCSVLVRKPDFRISRWIPIALIIVFSAAVLIFVIWADLPPRFDQRAVRSVAADLLYEIQDDFVPGGYGEIYPHNAGIILFDELIIRIAGYDNYLVIQFVNLACMILTMAALYGIIKKLTGRINGAMLSFCIFLPYWLYATFMYGTIPGFCCACWGIFFSLGFMEKERPGDAVAAGIFLAAAFRFKENFIILIIAVILLVLLTAVHEKKIRLLLFFIPLAVFYLLSGIGVNAGIRMQTGHDTGEGIPGISYMAMGLHEQEERGAGWHDNFPEDTYEATGYDPCETSRLSKEDIGKSVQNFAEHPAYAVGFFIRKTASLWDDPTYYSWTLQQGRNDRSDEEFIVPGIRWAYGIMDIMQSALYFFSLAWFWMHRRDNDLLRLVFAIIFIGGFLCHTLWEAHSQYTLLYAFGLCIYASEGLRELGVWAGGLSRNKKAGTAALLLAAGLLLSIPSIASFLTLSRDNLRFAEYMRL